MHDFPATHSVDTDWFAIDKEGNIAIFDADHDGTVPELYHQSESFSDFLYCFLQSAL